MKRAGALNKSDKIYTVSEITRRIKLLLEEGFRSVWVEGEISNVRRPSSGHCYFTLKDEESQIGAVIYRSAMGGIPCELTDGLAVVALGSVSVYGRRGSYQIRIRKLEPKGLGALQLAFDQLKEKLRKEGLFDRAKKKPIPLLPSRIGVVTSPTGAAIRDILNVLGRRFSNIHLILYPVRVQGETAGGEISRALDRLNQLDLVDVIIVGRGGGSLEDLWAFNEEEVARAISRSRIPVISAVGHEIDFTISDFAADLRAPTPSTAAEMVISRRDELLNALAGWETRLSSSADGYILRGESRLGRLRDHYVFREPSNIVNQHSQTVDEMEGRLRTEIAHLLERETRRLKNGGDRLRALDPRAVMARGYSICIREQDGSVITDADSVILDEGIITMLHRGSFKSIVKEVQSPSRKKDT